MDKYKKITDLGLEVVKADLFFRGSLVVSAVDLLKVLNSGVEVTGFNVTDPRFNWSKYPTSRDTHSGLVIGIKELKPKQVTITRADLDKAWKKAREGSCIDLNEIAKELGL